MRRLHELIASQPADSVALIDHNAHELSYGALDAAADALADTLAAHGVRAGDRVVLVSENCALFVVAVFALSRLAAWMVPVNARQSALEVSETMAHAGARCALLTVHVSEAAADHARRLAARRLCDTSVGPVVVSEPVECEPESVYGTDNDVAALMYTTGTTSKPKAVMLSHRNLITNTLGVVEVWQATPLDCVLCALPMTHVFGFASLLLPSLYAGATVVLHTRFVPAAVVGALAGGVTVFPAVPQMMSALLTHIDNAGDPLSAPRIRRISCGGAPLDPDLKVRAEAHFGVSLGNGYGITEAAPTVASSRLDRPRSDHSVGWPVAGMALRIDNPDTDGVGEICLRGKQIMLGYYRDPDSTRAAFSADGWFKTGDLGRLADDGALFIVGRLKELIIRSGFNVYPPEVEAMLTRHPAVQQAAVVGQTVDGNENIVAFVLTDGSVTGTTLQAWLKERLVAYKVPQRVCVVSQFPTAATGKVLKHLLLDTFAGHLTLDAD